MSKVKPINDYERAKLEYNKNILPLSALALYEPLSSGRVVIDQNNHFENHIDSAIPDSSNIYQHEKQSNTSLYLIKVPETDLYQNNYFNVHSNEKTISYSALELGAFNGQRAIASIYDRGGYYNTGTSLPSYNHLKTEENEDLMPIRLDIYLHSIGLKEDLETFYDYQTFINHPQVQNDFTVEALDALVIRGFFSSIKTGQFDKNSRNAILQFSPSKKKIIAYVEIDGEFNSYFTTINNERSGRRIMPKGIFKSGKYGYGESFDEFIDIVRHHKEHPEIDWELFAGYHRLSKYFFDTNQKNYTNYVTNIILNGYYINKGRSGVDPNGEFIFKSQQALGRVNYEDFGNYIVSKINAIDSLLDEALCGVKEKLPKIDESIEPLGKFKSKLYDKKYNEVKLSDEEYKQLGLE